MQRSDTETDDPGSIVCSENLSKKTGPSKLLDDEVYDKELPGIMSEVEDADEEEEEDEELDVTVERKEEGGANNQS